MTERTFDELIAYFNRTVADMNIPQKYKMELLGMITAIGAKYNKDVPKWNIITTRPMDNNERKDWSERLGYELDDDEAVIYGNLPDEAIPGIKITNND